MPKLSKRESLITANSVPMALSWEVVLNVAFLIRERADCAWSRVWGSLGGKESNTWFVVLPRMEERSGEDVESEGNVLSEARKSLFTSLYAIHHWYPSLLCRMGLKKKRDEKVGE